MNGFGLMENGAAVGIRKSADSPLAAWKSSPEGGRSFPHFPQALIVFLLGLRIEKHWLVNGTGGRAPGFERRTLDWAMWYGKPEPTSIE